MKSINKNNSNLLKLVFSGLSAALICLATTVFIVPLPTGGYVNLGDCFIILSGCMLTPMYGALAAGIGSALADVFLGFAIYAPVTFIVKALMAVTVYFITKIACTKTSPVKILNAASASAAAEIVMVSGYFFFFFIIYGYAGALADVFGNIVQALFAVAASVMIYSFMLKSKLFDYADNIINKNQKGAG